MADQVPDDSASGGDVAGMFELAGSSTVKLAAGMIRQHPEPLDLCKECSERFSDWLRGGRQANHGGAGGAIGDATVVSMALSDEIV